MRSKLTRASPWSSLAESGNVFIVRGEWNKAFIDECELFPVGPHDDQVDAVSGAYQFLVENHGRVHIYGGQPLENNRQDPIQRQLDKVEQEIEELILSTKDPKERMELMRLAKEDD
jgi:hypothetical protein